MSRFLLFAFAIFFISPANSAECKGHVFFYNLREHQSEVETDFAHFYKQVIPWFEERNISTSVHTSTPFISKTCFGDDVRILNDKLEQSLGYVLLKPTNQFKIIGGVITDLDLVIEANDFFY